MQETDPIRHHIKSNRSALAESVQMPDARQSLKGSEQQSLKQDQCKRIAWVGVAGYEIVGSEAKVGSK